MAAQRAVQRSLLHKFTNSNNAYRTTRTLPIVLAGYPLGLSTAPARTLLDSSSLTQKRWTSTPSHVQPLAESEAANKILDSQRRHRPVAPHLGIYQPQVTWYLSALNRITGSVLSGGLYLFSALYVVSPALGFHMESAVLAASVATWPVIAKVAAKFFIAMPFTFHCFNGLRHLSWDLGWAMEKTQVQRTGWAVVGLTVLSSLWLTML